MLNKKSLINVVKTGLIFGSGVFIGKMFQKPKQSIDGYLKAGSVTVRHVNTEQANGIILNLSVGLDDISAAEGILLLVNKDTQ